jgi:hypothetical protein
MRTRPLREEIIDAEPSRFKARTAVPIANRIGMVADANLVH